MGHGILILPLLCWVFQKLILLLKQVASWRAIAVTKVLNFLCLNARYICGVTMQTTTKLVVNYTIWAMVEVRNEPFLGFSLLVCLTNGKKGEFGELGDLD